MAESRRIQFEVIKFGRVRTERWEETNYYCPGCAAKTVYELLGSDDYYLGPDYLCRACGAYFNMPVFRQNDNFNMNSLALLRAFSDCP
jgi:hypothetical protein